MAREAGAVGASDPRSPEVSVLDHVTSIIDRHDIGGFGSTVDSDAAAESIVGFLKANPYTVLLMLGYEEVGQRLLYTETLSNGRLRNHFTPTFSQRRPSPPSEVSR